MWVIWFCLAVANHETVQTHLKFNRARLATVVWRRAASVENMRADDTDAPGCLMKLLTAVSQARAISLL